MMNQIRPNRWFSSSSSESNDNDASEQETISGSSQHDTWVQFQRSIAVSGFDTGQTVKERQLGKKNRGGKIDRRRREREAEAEAALKGMDVTQLKGGEFPTLSYSDEETERLLAEAYAAIPPRGGKRGTLNLKRQKRRWWIKRQYDARKKWERKQAYARKLEKKMKIKQEIKDMRAGAADVRQKDVEYHNVVLQRWAEMNGHSGALGGLAEEKREKLVSAGWKV